MYKYSITKTFLNISYKHSESEVLCQGQTVEKWPSCILQCWNAYGLQSYCTADGYVSHEQLKTTAAARGCGHLPCSTVLTTNVQSTLLMCILLYTTLLLVCDYDQPTTVTSSSHVHGPLSLAAAVSACADQRFGTNFHRICKAQTLGNSLNIGLRAGYLSVRTWGGTSNSCWLKERSINGLTYLLIWNAYGL